VYNQPSDPSNPQQYEQQYYQQQPGYGQQPPPQTTGTDYGQYGQQMPPYGQQMPPYGQAVPPYAQAQPMPYAMQAGVMGPQKDWLVTLLLCLFLGCFGVHRFYTGHVAIGLVQLFTFGGCGIWALVDFILIITGSYTDNYRRPLLRN
jgi:TM2 domain-containing membrane protein YozV